MIGIHENGELRALNNGYTLGSGGGSGTSIPTADTNAQFDSDAHMNSTDMTTGSGGEVEEFVDELNVTGGLLGDYVVEQGESNGWKYRKWNSGTAELWYFNLTKSSQAFTAWGSLYYADWNTGLSFPFTLTSAPIVYITPYDSQAYVIGNWGNSTSGVGTIRFGHNGTSAVGLHVHLYVYGTWK